jgi:NAD(P)-dependent dehydrogenase (short-subunit alcohol dehydrogenase family)
VRNMLDFLAIVSGSRAGVPPRATNAVLVITGASSGIGRCSAGLFARHGWRVGLIARGGAGLQAAYCEIERLGAMAAMAQADVADMDALETAAASIEETPGPIDVWVNCAESVQKLGRRLPGRAACASGSGIGFVWSRLIGLATVGASHAVDHRSKVGRRRQ